MRVLILEVMNWEKYNPRSDVKSASWFRMSNSFFSDADFYGKSASVRLTWLSILCEASVKMSAIVKINTLQIANSITTQELPLTTNCIESAISELKLIKNTSNQPILIDHTESNNINTIESDRNIQSKCPLHTDIQTNKQTNVTNNITEKNKPARSKQKKALVSSTLAFLFEPTDEIQVWLLTGTEQAQRDILTKYSHHVLVEEIKKAYLWQLEHQARNAGMFLVTWMSNKKTSAFNPKQAKASVSEVTPDNLTGNPFKTKLDQIRGGGKSA